ncbi:MAG TPA: DUF192 domain-containing protein [Candidatus Paceibacterota bacterium]
MPNSPKKIILLLAVLVAIAALVYFAYVQFVSNQSGQIDQRGTTGQVLDRERDANGELSLATLLPAADRSAASLSIRSGQGVTALEVDVVNTEQSQAQGLSGKETLGGKGMLFAFRQPGSYSLWMKDMLFPLDMIWIDRSGYIVHIEKDVSPESYPKPFSPPVESQFIIEVSAGFAQFFNISVGDKVTVK